MEIGQFAALEVARTRKDGALLDWGRQELLPLPLEEQRFEVRKGDTVVVYITTDDRVFERPMATMKWEEHLQHDPEALQPNQKVELLLAGVSELGFDAIIDGKHRGMLYHNEVFGEPEVGHRIEGFVKKIREDGKIDLITQLRGTRGTTDLGTVIKEELQSQGGFLPLNDKSDPQEIYRLFGVSKKKFKMAIGRLFKHRDITIDEDGIRLAE